MLTWKVFHPPESNHSLPLTAHFICNQTVIDWQLAERFSSVHLNDSKFSYVPRNVINLEIAGGVVA